MKLKKEPLRTCVVTKEKCLKKDLLRIVRDVNGEAQIDLTGKLNGRGAYIKKDPSVVDKAKKTKTLEHHLEITISDELYDKIKEVIGG